MFVVPEYPLYVLDSEGRQQLFDVEKLKTALQEAFVRAGDPESYLADDIALAIESAMYESARQERTFTQSEVDEAVSRILENAGCANVAQSFRRANSRLYIDVDVNVQAAADLITRHLGVTAPAVDKLSLQVVQALQLLKFTSASPALYLELARHYERMGVTELEVPVETASCEGKFLLTKTEALESLPPEARTLYENKIINLNNIGRLYPNFRLTLNLNKLAESLELTPPITEMQFAPLLYQSGEAVGRWLRLLAKRLPDVKLPLYLQLAELDKFTERWLGTPYPEGKPAAMENVELFRSVLDYPVKKCTVKKTNKDVTE